MLTEISIFSISLFLLISFLGLKYWERKQGKVLLEGVRKQADVLVEHHANRMYVHSIHIGRHVSHQARHHSTRQRHVLTQKFLSITEHILTRLLDKIRGKNKLKKRGQASQYLVDVARREEE